MNNHKVSHPPGTEVVSQSLGFVQQNLLALQKLSEQTAQLHRQFLDGQDHALQVFQALLQQQQSLLTVPVRAVPPALEKLTYLPARNGETTANHVASPQAADPVARGEARRFVAAPTVSKGLPAAAPQARPVAPAPVVESRVAEILLQIVAEKTGYPAEMLAPEMELDADLGIDSIKRVEIFSALQERLPHAPAIQSEHIGSLRTLADVAEFLQADAAKHVPSNGVVHPDPAPSAPRPIADDSADILLQVVSEKTGYPAEMLAPEMELDADLGIDSIKRVEIFSALQERLPHAPTIGTEEMPALRTLQDVMAFLGNGSAEQQKKNSSHPADNRLTEDASPQAAVLLCHRYAPRDVALPDAPARPRRPLSQGAAVWIVAESSLLSERLAERLQLLGYVPRVCTVAAAVTLTEPLPAALIILPPTRGSDDAFLFDAFRLLQTAGPALRQQAASGAAVLTVSHLDGGFGFISGSTVDDPLSGGLAGLVKTAAREWPEVRCKALDVSPALDPEEAALAVAAELEMVGPLEVGITVDGLLQVRLESAEVAARDEAHGSASPQVAIRRGDLFLVTGGARGITAAVSLELAKRFAPTLILLGRSPAPTAEPDWLVELQDPQEIKRQLLHYADRPLSPRELDQRFHDITAGREIRRNLRQIADAGSKVHYRQADVRDAAVVQNLVRDLRRQFGPVAGLIHGAGVIADRRIEDKVPEQFRVVYDTKVVGLRNLLAAVANDPLHTLLLFSSSTARFGRVGQADYAAANEVLNKMAQAESRRRPGCHVVSLNWGPWAGGMVHHGLQKIFAAEGLDLIPLDAGARLAVDSIARTGSAVEEVVLAGDSPDMRESIAKPQVATPAACGLANNVERPGSPALTPSFSREVNLETCPVLRSHVIGGRAVVPLVLHLEWLAHGAVHANPGLLFHGFDDLRLLKGVKLEEEQSCTLRILTGKPVRQHGEFYVPVELHQDDADRAAILHARATIVLTNRLPDAPAASVAEPSSPYPRTVAEAYQSQLFHGAELQGIRRIDGVAADAIAGVVAVAPPPARWLVRPLRGAWLAEPLVLDASFQLMVLWCREKHGMPLLPAALGRYRQFCRAFPRGDVRVLARITAHTHQHVRADIDYVDAGGKLLARLENSEWIRDASLTDSFRRNQLAIPVDSN